MLILICGDRNWPDKLAIEREFNNHNITKDDTIIEGEARGADTLARLVAEDRGIKVIRMPADWTKHGKAAGPIRNQAMLDLNPDLVLAFHPDIVKSKGTGHMVRIAKAKGVKVEVYAH